MKWTRVPDLVEKRRVFLKGGLAYVPAREQSSIIFEQFQRKLEEALQVRLSSSQLIIPTHEFYLSLAYPKVPAAARRGYSDRPSLRQPFARLPGGRIVRVVICPRS